MVEKLEGALTNFTCNECGKFEKNQWVPEHARKLRDRGLCFECNFWIDYVARASQSAYDQICVRTSDWIHLTICDENTHGLRGFDGRRFVFLFDDGCCVESTNVRYQGVIPEHFRDRLRPNAKIVSVEPQNTADPID